MYEQLSTDVSLFIAEEIVVVPDILLAGYHASFDIWYPARYPEKYLPDIRWNPRRDIWEVLNAASIVIHYTDTQVVSLPTAGITPEILYLDLERCRHGG